MRAKIILQMFTLGIALVVSGVRVSASNGGGRVAWSAFEKLHEKPYKNAELQTYLPSNATIHNGIFILKSVRKGSSISSGAIALRKDHAFRYGRIEVRARLPQGRGLFPAIWMMTAAGHHLPEIDIVELLGQQPHLMWGVYHYRDRDGRHQRVFTYVNGPNYAAAYHTYGLRWAPDGLTWTVDGHVVLHTRKSPHERMYLILNLAVGGNWPGAPDASFRSAEMRIAWVKIRPL
jgi:beta-glucanase (GH16 family)